jgi:aquaporin Z
MKDIISSLIAECIGTMLVVSALLLSSVSSGPLALSAAVLVASYMFQNISGAHFNPIVSAANTVLGKLTVGQLIAFVVAQVAGGSLGVLLNVFINS